MKTQTVGTAGVWWWLRGRTLLQHAPPPPDPDSFMTPVAKVAKLYLYPSSLVTGLSWIPHSFLLEDSSMTGKFKCLWWQSSMDQTQSTHASHLMSPVVALATGIKMESTLSFLLKSWSKDQGDLWIGDIIVKAGLWTGLMDWIMVWHWTDYLTNARLALRIC